MIIETHHVAKHFGRFEAIEEFNLNVPWGPVFALIGSNGTGDLVHSSRPGNRCSVQSAAAPNNLGMWAQRSRAARHGLYA